MPSTLLNPSSSQPDGLETSVGARGAQLSGGQKQRIAIARALVKNPDILILDEATSALDAESETLVNSALAALLRGNNTTISIAHRLSTIKRSDTIVVLGNDGRVAEQGSYKDLSSRKDGAFTKLMEWQMSGGETAGLAHHGAEAERRDMAVSGEGGRGPPTEKEEIQHLHVEGAHEGEGGADLEEEHIEGSKTQEVVEKAVEKSGQK